MRRLTRTIFTPALVVFLAVMLLVAISFVMSRNNINRDLETVISKFTLETEGNLKDRLNIFEETLRAGLGLVEGNPNLTNSQWEQFLKTSAVIERYPGAQGVIYARAITTDQIPAFTAEVQPKTVANYQVHPLSTGTDMNVPLLFIAPPTPTNVQFFGFNLVSDPARRKAIENARDSGQITLSEIVQSPFDNSAEGKTFVMYLPQYKLGMPTSTVDQRRQAIEGYADVAFRVNRFMSTVVPTQDARKIAFKVSIDEAKSEFYRSQNFDEVTKGKHTIVEHVVEIGGSKLHFSYAYNPTTILPDGASNRPLRVFLFGIVVALLISYTILLVLRAKANDLLLEQERGINDAKDNLLSLASHQLRTPATGVKQYLGLILQGFAGDITPRQRNILEKAYDGNERQLKTINDILYVARLGSGRIVLSKSEFSIPQLVREVVKELDHDIKEKHHRVIVKAPKKKQLFTGDEHMIRMAVENLLTNAIKYTHQKGRITVKVTKAHDVKISVEDNGLGIPADQQDRMFQQFERIDNELSIAVGGTGIGLYVVQNIAELHNGHVEVTSRVGKGSKFTLVLPAKQPKKSDEV